MGGQLEDGTILVFGMPRSGTTWLGKIFDSHSQTLYRHEPDSWSKLSEIPLMPSMKDASQYAEYIQLFNAGLPGIRAAKVCAKQPLFRKQYLSGFRFWVMKIGSMLSQLADRAGVSVPVVGAIKKPPVNSKVVWKSIESIGRLGVILEALPQSRCVHIVRHPCGYVASVLRGEKRRKFQDNRGASEDYGVLTVLLETEAAKEIGITLSDLKDALPEERLAWRWALSTEKAIRETRQSDRCMLIRYEDLCRNPISIIKSTYEFVGLNYDAQTDAFLKASVRHQDDAYYSVYKDPLTAANRWKDELEEIQVQKILDISQLVSSGRLFDERDS